MELAQARAELSRSSLSQERHMRASGLSAADKSVVTAACQQLIDGFLKPRFLATIRPTQFNYPVDILGKWHGTKYRLI